ncbi:MAG: T9SS type A sorting domain-containing protein [Calditrichae bacterium]|nr:T9SS type A sorting domain-containing protein [Calditrichia bacterium]
MKYPFWKNTHFNEGSGINRVWLEKDSSEIEAMNFTVINNTELQALFNPPVAADTGIWNLFIESNIDGTISYQESIRIFEPPAIVDVNIDSIITTLDVGDSIDINISITNNAAINGDTLSWQAEIKTLFSNITLPSTPPTATIINYKKNAQTSMFVASNITSNRKTIKETPALIKTETGNIAYGIELLNLNTFVKFGLNDPESLNEITPISASYFAGDFDDKGTFYTINNSNQTLAYFDTLTGAETSVGPMEALPGHNWTGLSYNFTDGSFYASSSSGISSALYSVDHFTGSVVLIGETFAAPVIIDIAVDNNGVLFAHEIVNDAIYTVDKLTGQVNFIGYTGFDANYAQGMDCDPNNNEIYLAAFNNSSSTAELRKVNKSNGQTTFIGFIGDGYSYEMCAFGISGNAPSFAKIISEKAGQIAPGDIGGFTLRLYALDIPDTTYYANINIKTNDPFTPTIEIPILIKANKSVNITSRNSIPVKFQINQNYPNPFNPSTNIEYAIPYQNRVRVTIYNILGQMVRKLVDEPQQPGKYKVLWNGRNDNGNQVASGTYILKFEAGKFRRSYKLILTK